MVHRSTSSNFRVKIHPYGAQMGRMELVVRSAEQTQPHTATFWKKIETQIKSFLEKSPKQKLDI